MMIGENKIELKRPVCSLSALPASTSVLYPALLLTRHQF
jgi:hypothetical protein